MVSPVLGHLGATLSLLLPDVVRGFVLQCFRCHHAPGHLVLVRVDLHRLVELVLDDFARRRFDIFQRNCRLLGGALRLQPFALGRDVLLVSGGEGLPHVLVPLVLLVDQVVRCRDVVVAIGLQAADRVLLLELEVVYEPHEQLSRVGHLLEAGEEAGLARLLHGLFRGLAHVGVLSDVRDADTRLWVCVQDFCNEVFALG